MSGSNPTCVSCQYALAYMPVPTKLWCRRYPPIVTSNNPAHAIFPIVGLSDWCGEYAIISTPPISPPVNLTVPFVSQSGSGVGSTLVCTMGNWENEPTSYSYQWLRGGSIIIGTNSPSYTVVSNDVGRTVTCIVTASNAIGSTAAPPSNGITVA